MGLAAGCFSGPEQDEEVSIREDSSFSGASGQEAMPATEISPK